MAASAGAEEEVSEQAHAGGRRILVAEDSSITHELLKLLLDHRGHHVDIASDGLEALEALRRTQYDVALLDFHLPSLDGAQIAATIRRESRGKSLPRLVAITGDVEGLLGTASCENFDHVIPKPLDIYQVGKIVEEQADIGERLLKTAAGGPQQAAQVVSAMRPTTSFESLGYECLAWPDDLQAGRLSPRAMQASLGDPRFDAILIRSAVGQMDLGSIWRHKSLHVLPVIDLTGTLGQYADFDASKLGTHNTGALAELIRKFQDGRARLHRDLLLSEAIGEQILARVFVSGRPLAPFYEPQSKSFIAYNTIIQSAIIAKEAERLSNEGLFQRSFFDRFHICSRCESTRMNVREECSKCRSASLVEDSYLHHFRCAHQGPSSEFRRGNDLTCPKCRRDLEHFGFDYDRPGTMVVCQSCGHADSEPEIGFVCIDCGAHADSGSCMTRDTFSYQLNEQGIGFAEFGHSFMGHARRALRFADLPIDLVVALNTAAKSFNEEKAPFTLVSVSYQNEREITADQGARQFAQARDLFLENMRTAIGDIDVLIKGRSYDFLLLRDIAPGEAALYFDQLREHSQETVRFDLGAQFQAFGPEDIA